MDAVEGPVIIDDLPVSHEIVMKDHSKVRPSHLAEDANLTEILALDGIWSIIGSFGHEGCLGIL